MASHERIIRIQWENGETFKIDSKLDDDEYYIVCQMDEQGDIVELWSPLQKLCETYFKTKMNEVGDAMRAE